MLSLCFSLISEWNLAKSHNPVLTVKLLLFIINCKTIMFNLHVIYYGAAAAVECSWQSKFVWLGEKNSLIRIIN